MTSIRYSDLFESDVQQICVPTGTETMTVCEAALAWVESGFYVVPISSGTKHAGSILGKGWPEKSSRDTWQVESWFAREDVGLAIHVGRSGAIAFDVDRPSALPFPLREWLFADFAPFQATRVGQPHRGHHLFAALPGRAYGNSSGRLGSTWGEVRGRNGIIVVAPTSHAKSHEGGQYCWERTGIVPPLPFELDQRLPQRQSQSLEAVDLAEVQAFLDQHISTLAPECVMARLQSMHTWIDRGRSRHDSTRNALTWVLKDAMAGLCDAKTALDQVLNEFVMVKPREEWSSASEFTDMVRWAVAQVQDTAPEELVVRREAALTAANPSVQAWIRGL